MPNTFNWKTIWHANAFLKKIYLDWKLRRWFHFNYFNSSWEKMSHRMHVYLLLTITSNFNLKKRISFEMIYWIQLAYAMWYHFNIFCFKMHENHRKLFHNIRDWNDKLCSCAMEMESWTRNKHFTQIHFRYSNWTFFFFFFFLLLTNVSVNFSSRTFS